MKRRTYLHLILALAAFGVTTTVMLLVLREPMEPLTAASLDAARDRWQSSGVRRYRIRYRMNGGLYDVTVDDRIVTAATLDERPLRSADPGAYAVEGLFHTLELDLENVSDPHGPFAGKGGVIAMRVRFNSDLGYVERYLRSSGGAGRGASIEVLAFHRTE